MLARLMESSYLVLVCPRLEQEGTGHLPSASVSRQSFSEPRPSSLGPNLVNLVPPCVSFAPYELLSLHWSLEGAMLPCFPCLALPQPFVFLLCNTAIFPSHMLWRLLLPAPLPWAGTPGSLRGTSTVKLSLSILCLRPCYQS